MARMRGYRPGEMVGRSIFGHVEKEWRDVALRKFSERSERSAERYEFNFLREVASPCRGSVSGQLSFDNKIFGATSVSGTQAGWTAGGGAEWAFRDNCRVNGEYLYDDLGKSGGSTTNHAFPSGPAPTIGPQSQFTQCFCGKILRAGVNDHFNDASNAPVVPGC